MTALGFAWPYHACPEVSVAGRFPLDDRDFDHVYCAETHALHVYDYHGAIRIGQREYPLHPGDFTLSPRLGETRYHLPRPGHHWCIHFRADTSSGRSCLLPLHIPLGGIKGRITDAVARISGLMASPDTSGLHQAAASHALQELLLTVAAHAQTNPQQESTARTDEAVRQATDHIAQHIGEELSVPGLAAMVGLSQNWLARAFHAHHGQTLQRYLLTRRIAHAQDLLVTTDLPVGRIAQRLGFGDSQHFNKQFRRFAGCNPTTYRQRAQRRR